MNPPKIVNLVASGKFQRTFDLCKIKKDLQSENVTIYFRPQMLVIRNDGTVMLFKSGSIIINGVKSIEDANRLLIWFCYKQNLPVININICTITAVAHLNKTVRLDVLGALKQISYEPEIFPNAVIIINRIKIHIFHTGSLIFMGGKRLDDILKAYNGIITIINKM